MTTVRTQPLPMGRGLGRHVEHDPRSRLYDVAPTATATPIAARMWRRHSPILDQGSVGSCTGNAMAGWLACEPHCTTDTTGQLFDEQEAVRLYSTATHLDRFPGQYPPDDTGSSGNGVAKAARKLRLIRSWSWAFTTTGMLHALMSGPVIAGIEWSMNMYNPDPDGVVSPAGDVAGGHEVLIRGWDGTHLWCDNSWGPFWGPIGGSFKLTADSWNLLRARSADVTVPHV